MYLLSQFTARETDIFSTLFQEKSLFRQFLKFLSVRKINKNQEIKLWHLAHLLRPDGNFLHLLFDNVRTPQIVKKLYAHPVRKLTKDF